MNVKIFYGGEKGFEKIIPSDGKYKTIVDIALLNDEQSRQISIKGLPIHQNEENDEISHCDDVVAFSNDYASLTEGAVENFVSLVLRNGIANLYLQNPPDRIAKQIQAVSGENCRIKSQKYKSIDIDMIRKVKSEFSETVIGQETAKRDILATLYYVAKHRYDKPCVIMLYGSTGIGKTESVKLIAKVLGGELFRKQFSMLQNNEFASYIFGGNYNQSSLAKDLLERETNIILFDEFDKANPVFHSAFYQLFDEGVYTDKNFTVKMKDAIIFCTSNYMSEREIKASLGEPIFSRLDATIMFDKLSKDSIRKIVTKEIEEQYDDLDDEEKMVIDKCHVKERIFSLIDDFENVRGIKKTVKNAFSAALINEFL